MKLICQEKIHNALSQVQPHSIAVDFIGLDWETYIDIAGVQQMIVSPTVGSHPAAIEQLVARIAGQWEGVYFLDQLHTKLYIGADFVAMGSFNLAQHSVVKDGRAQVGVFSNNAQFRADAETLFENLKVQAQRTYPDTASKMRKLAELAAVSPPVIG